MGYDILVIGGDLTTYGTVPEAVMAIHELRSFAKPLVVVAGNMDPPELDDLFMALGVSINGRGCIVGDVGFFGVSAVPISPLRTPNEIPESKIKELAEAGWSQVTKAKRTVFVPHAPPYNTLVDRIGSGKHVGSTSVRQFIEERQPDLVICGHIHEARGVDSIEKSRIVNCGPAGRGYYALINIGTEVSIEAKQDEGLTTGSEIAT